MAEIEIPSSIAEGNQATSTFTATSTSSLNGLTLSFQDTNGVQYSSTVNTSTTVANSTAVEIGASGASTLSDLSQAVHRSLDQAIKFGITSSTKNTADGSALMPISLADISPDAPSATLQTATAIAGKAVLTISGDPSNSESFTLIDSDGTSTTFTIDTSSTASTTTVGVQSVLGSNSDLATKVAACVNSVSALDITATANSPSTGKVLLVQGTTGTASCTTITENVTNFAFAGRADGTGTANKFQEVIDLDGLTLIFDDQDGNQYSAAAENTVTKANSTAVKIGTSDVVTINDLAESIRNSVLQAISYGVTASTKDTSDGSELLGVAAGSLSTNTFTLTYSTKGIIGEGNTVSGTLVSGSHVSLAASFAAPAKALLRLTGLPADTETFQLTDTGGTSQTFTIDTSTDTDTATAATATIVFTDKPNETSTITLEDSDGTSITFEIDDDNDGVSGSNVAVTEITENGGGATGTAFDLAAKINGESTLDISAVASSGTLTLTQGTAGRPGNTTITYVGASWATATSSKPAEFTGGVNGGTVGTSSDTTAAQVATSIAASINGVSALGITATASSARVTLVQDTTGSAGNRAITNGLSNATFAGLSDGSGTANKFLNAKESFTVTQSVAGTEGNNTVTGTLLSSNATMPTFTGGTGGPNAIDNAIRADKIEPTYPTTGAVLLHGMQIKTSGQINHVIGAPFTVLKTFDYTDITAAVVGSSTNHTFDLLSVPSGYAGWQVIDCVATLGIPFSSSGITIQAGVVSTPLGTDDDGLITAQNCGSAVPAGSPLGHLNAQKGTYLSSPNSVMFAVGASDKVTVKFNDSAALSGLTAGQVNVYVTITLASNVEYS